MYFLHVHTLSHTCICTVYNVYVFMDRVKRSFTLFLQLKKTSYAMSSGSCPPIRVRYSLETKYPNVTSVPSVQATLSLYLLVRTHTHTHTHTYMCIHIFQSKQLFFMWDNYTHVHVYVHVMQMYTYIQWSSLCRLDTCCTDTM